MLYDPKRWTPPTAPATPQFGPRLHSRSRLDIRPVLWSLRNRPEEWERSEYTLDHKPSKHEFWTGNGFWFYGLYRANGCSCKRGSYGSFSFIQKVQFGLARRAWRRAMLRSPDWTQVNAQFAAHFLPTETDRPLVP